MPEDALVELTGATGSAPTVREVVEDEQFTGPQAHLDFSGVNGQATLLENVKLIGQTGELGAAKKAGLCLDARQDRNLAEGGLDDPREATFHVAGSASPCAVAVAVSS